MMMRRRFAVGSAVAVEQEAAAQQWYDLLELYSEALCMLT